MLPEKGSRIQLALRKSDLTQQIYLHYLAESACYEITVEAPSESFQLMKDSLDMKLMMDMPEFSEFKALLSSPLKDAKAIFDHSRKLNKDVLQKVAERIKIRQAQISRVFDIILLACIEENDSFATSAYKGFLRKKIERLNSQILFSRVKEKYIEYEGKVIPVTYSNFAPNNPERSL